MVRNSVNSGLHFRHLRVGNLHVRCAVGYRKRAKDGTKTPVSGALVTLVEQSVPVLLLSDIELFPMEHSNSISHEDSCCA